MDAFRIYDTISDHFRKAAQSTVGEIPILKVAIDSLEKHKWPDPLVKVRTKFVHQKPYALFVNPPTIWGKKRTELGDILFVIKYKDAGQIVDHRAIFSQLKYDSGSMNFAIEMHQLAFYLDIHDIEFRFGNRVYGNARIEPITWQKISTALNFGFDLLIGPNCFCDIDVELLSLAYPGKSSHFNIDKRLAFTLHRYLRPRPFHIRRPLIDFFRIYGRGNKISGDFEVFVELIYKYLGLIMDPPEEHKGYWEENKKGFGLIEIQVGE